MARPGNEDAGPARWPYTPETRERIRRNLAAYDRRTDPASRLRAAAVSVVLASSPGGATAFALTLRPPRMKAHAGQYALPGGKVDAGEDAQTAALRELREELGAAVAPEQILGKLDDLPTRSGYLVTPFVIWLGDGVALHPAPDEIAELYRIPVSDLFAGRGRGRNRGLSEQDESGTAVFSLFIPTLSHDLFAPTAAIMDHFRAVALLGLHTPAVRFGEPRFARI